MSKHSSPAIRVVVHLPKFPTAQAVLARQVAEAHARIARAYIEDLHCPRDKKVHLAKAVATAVQKK